MAKKTPQSGFALIELVLAIAVGLISVGGLGYYARNQSKLALEVEQKAVEQAAEFEKKAMEVTKMMNERAGMMKDEMEKMERHTFSFSAQNNSGLSGTVTLMRVPRGEDSAREQASSKASGKMMAPEDDSSLNGESPPKQNDGKTALEHTSTTPRESSTDLATGKTMMADDWTQVKIDLSIHAGMSPGTKMPAHIHVGACSNPGAVKYPLADVVGGKSTTVVHASVDELLKELPLVVNVHKSGIEIKTFVACADLSKDGFADKTAGDKVISPQDASSGMPMGR